MDSSKPGARRRWIPTAEPVIGYAIAGGEKIDSPRRTSRWPAWRGLSGHPPRLTTGGDGRVRTRRRAQASSRQGISTADARKCTQIRNAAACGTALICVHLRASAVEYTSFSRSRFADFRNDGAVPIATVYTIAAMQRGGGRSRGRHSSPTHSSAGLALGQTTLLIECVAALAEMPSTMLDSGP